MSSQSNQAGVSSGLLTKSSSGRATCFRHIFRHPEAVHHQDVVEAGFSGRFEEVLVLGLVFGQLVVGDLDARQIREARRQRPERLYGGVGAHGDVDVRAAARSLDGVSPGRHFPPRTGAAGVAASSPACAAGAAGGGATQPASIVNTTNKYSMLRTCILDISSPPFRVRLPGSVTRGLKMPVV